MTMRPEDYGGVTDPLASFANTSTMPGKGAGKAIDPSKPSLEQPGLTADRIAELEREIAHVESGFIGPANLERLTLMRAELSRLRNEQPRQEQTWLDRAKEQAPGIDRSEVEFFEELKRRDEAPSPATSPGPQDVRIVGIIAKELPTIQIEKAEAIVAALLSAFPALAQSDAQINDNTLYAIVDEATADIEKALGRPIDVVTRGQLGRLARKVAKACSAVSTQSDAQPARWEWRCKGTDSWQPVYFSTVLAHMRKYPGIFEVRPLYTLATLNGGSK